MSEEGVTLLDVEQIRNDFPVLSRMVHGKPLVYLDNAATSQKPRAVIQALTEYYETYNSNVHRGVHTLSMEATDRYEEAREKVARFINAEAPESIIWTRNATESLNLVAHSWAEENISEGDEIVVTRLEHHSNLVPWQRIAARKGAALRFLGMTEDGSVDMDGAATVINDKTKLLAVTHVSNSLGTVVPVKELAGMARSVGAAVLVDGAQSVPHQPVDVAGHRLRFPGALGAQDDGADRHRRPLRAAGSAGADGAFPARRGDGAGGVVRGRELERAADALRGRHAEYRRRHSALGAAVDYLTALGMENVREHEKQLTAYALDAFRELEEIDLFGPMDVDRRGGILSFYSSDVHPHDLGTFLDQEGVAIRTGHHCTMPLMGALGVPATARASLYVYNTEQEVDALVDALKRALRYFSDGASPAR